MKKTKVRNMKETKSFRLEIRVWHYKFDFRGSVQGRAAVRNATLCMCYMVMWYVHFSDIRIVTVIEPRKSHKKGHALPCFSGQQSIAICYSIFKIPHIPRNSQTEIQTRNRTGQISHSLNDWAQSLIMNFAICCFYHMTRHCVLNFELSFVLHLVSFGSV